jgi:flavin-dependent dehydrogenase
MAIALSRRGRDVVVVDRDRGPAPDGTWPRKGVMQFHQAHTMRRQIVDVLREDMPDVLEDLIGAGATIATTADNKPAALLCRRMLFDRVLRRAADTQGISVVTGHVDDVLRERGRTVGVKVAGRSQPADLVIDASGRASRFTGIVRPRADGADCGATYVSRQYRLRPDATWGPVNSPIGLSLHLPGYAAIAFLHDNRTFSITVVHDGADKRLAPSAMWMRLSPPYARCRPCPSGSDRHVRHPSPPYCPAAGCTTAIAANSTTRSARSHRA